MGNIEIRKGIDIDSLSQTQFGSEVSQRYFLLDEFTTDNPQRLENLRKNFPVISSFIDNVSDNKDSDQLKPLRIRLSEDASRVYLCFQDFAEGRRIDYFGQMIEGWCNVDGYFSIRNGEKIITGIPKQKLNEEIGGQITDIQARVSVKDKSYLF